MMTKRIVGVALAAALIVACYTCVRTSSPAARGGRAAAGLETTYELRWQARSVAHGDAELGASHGSVDVAGALTVRAIDPRHLGVRLDRVDRARLTVLGQDVLDPAPMLVGVEVVVELDERDEVVAVEAPADAPRGLAELLRSIAIQVVVPGRALGGGEVEAPALLGRARDRYVRDGWTVRRERLAYASLTALPVACAACTQAVDGGATLVLDGAGALVSLHDRETTALRDDGADVLSADNELVLTRASTRRAGTPARRGATRRLDAATAASASDDELRRRIAGDLTLDGIAGWIVRLAASGTPPDDPVWLARAAALLQLEPAHVDALLTLFEAPHLPAEARLMIADILVATGTPRAQAALRRAIELGGVAFDDVTYAALINRAGMLDAPTAETATFIAALRDAAGARALTIRGSALYTEGAVIGRLAATDRPAAVAMARELEAEALATDDADARATLLVALGNADLDETLPTILAETRHDDARVRAAAAMALHRRRGGEVGEALVDLAGDNAPEVQHIALHLLGTGVTDDADLDRLVAAVLAGDIAPGSDGTLVSTLAVGLGRVRGVPDALRVVLARNGHDRDLVARIEALLVGTPG